MAALAIALAGCASAPAPSQRLLMAETSLTQARADATTFESGRAALEKADVSISDAREFYMKREDDKYMHALRMGEGYVALANARGDQLDANKKIVTLNSSRADMVAAARTRQVATAEAATASAEAATAAARAATASAENRADASARVAATAVANTATANAARVVAEERAAAVAGELASYEQKKTDLGVMLILRDLQFASSSSVLSAGAQGRLAPLAAFLARQPDARIQIIGHTDSQGGDAANMTLSAQRAQSVGAYLNTTGVANNRVVASGMGESLPVATNDTAAGRAINRRVEVTILD